MSKQPEALGFAICLESRGYQAEAEELRRLHTENERLRAALEQPQVQASAIPAGWKLVPSDATHQWAENLADRGMRISSLASAISDMLAAAPQPPTVKHSLTVEQPQVEQEPVAWMVTSEMQDGTRSTYPMIGRFKDVQDCCDFGEPVPLIYQHPQPKRDLLLPKS